MDELSELQLHTLQLLADKRDGATVPFINIAAARTLTELGLASRSHEGWDITPKGSAILGRSAPKPSAER
jgi:hypothetical protein